jgi:hypothetical protein
MIEQGSVTQEKSAQCIPTTAAAFAREGGGGNDKKGRTTTKERGRHDGVRATGMKFYGGGGQPTTWSWKMNGRKRTRQR